MRMRVKFLSGQQRGFLLRVEEKSRLHPDKLAKIAGIVPRSYRDWKREKLHMTLGAALLFQKNFMVPLPENYKKMVGRWKKYKSEMGERGGLARFKKYGSPATPEGRRKGGTKALSILRARGVIPLIKKYNLPGGYSEQLAEYVGILLGDGGITPSQACITLNSEADKDYVNYVVALEINLFGTPPKTLLRKDSKAIAIYLNGIQLINYLVSIGLKTGNKVKQQVGVPEWIRLSRAYRIACLRGLMDTDGGVFLHKYKVNGKMYAYKKICFTNRSLPLLYFVDDILKELGLTPKLITKVENKKVWLYNKAEVEEYLGLVGTRNTRLLKYQTGKVSRAAKRTVR